MVLRTESILKRFLQTYQGLFNVSISRYVSPLNFFWLAFTLLVTSCSFFFYFLRESYAENRGGTFLGYVFGCSALLFLGLSLFLVIRKRLKAWSLGPTEVWLQAHVWLGILSFILALLHSAFMVSTLLSWVLILSYCGVVITGVAGSIIQTLVPPMLTGAVSYEVLGQEIPYKIERLQKKAKEVMEGKSGNIKLIYDKQVLPLLMQSSGSIQYFLRRFQRKSYLMMLFEHLRTLLPEDEEAAVLDFQKLVLEKEDLEFQRAGERLLEGWLLIHVPLSICLCIFVVLHVIQMLYYGYPL